MTQRRLRYPTHVYKLIKLEEKASVHLLGVDKKHIVNLEPVTNHISEVTCQNCIKQWLNS